MTGHPLSAICRTLGVSRSTAYRQTKDRPRFYRRAEDEAVLAEIRKVIRKRGSYGYRRVTVLLRRAGKLQEADPESHAHARPPDPSQEPQENGQSAHGQDRDRPVERALVLGCLRDPLLERGGGARGLCPGLLRPRGDRVCSPPRTSPPKTCGSS